MIGFLEKYTGPWDPLDGGQINLNGVMMGQDDFMHVFKYGVKILRQVKEELNPKRLQHSAQVLVRGAMMQRLGVELRDVKMIVFVAWRRQDTCAPGSLEENAEKIKEVMGLLEEDWVIENKEGENLEERRFVGG